MESFDANSFGQFPAGSLVCAAPNISVPAPVKPREFELCHADQTIADRIVVVHPRIHGQQLELKRGRNRF
jgi:hypothetical protein